MARARLPRTSHSDCGESACWGSFRFSAARGCASGRRLDLMGRVRRRARGKPLAHPFPLIGFIAMKRLLLLACACGCIADAWLRKSRTPSRSFFRRNPSWLCCMSPSKTGKGGYVGGLAQEALRCSRTAAAGNQLLQQPGRTGHRRPAHRRKRQHGAQSRTWVIAASMAFSKAMNPQDDVLSSVSMKIFTAPLPPTNHSRTSSQRCESCARASHQGARTRRRSTDALNAGHRVRAEGRLRTPGADCSE
jgi:hypothetical protein